MGAAFVALAGRPQEVQPEVRVWVEHGPREQCVDVLFVGDGYTRKHMGRAGKYWKDVNRCAKRLFEEFPFSWYEEHFNVRALMLESAEAGCDESREVDEVDTALDCCFDTPGGRLIVFRDEQRLAQLVKQAGGADIVFVMVNCERYGGAGTTLSGLVRPGEWGPAPTYSAQDTRSFLIAIHELGHSFAHLADEYVDEELHESFPLPTDGADLREANVTLRGRLDDADEERLDRALKWAHFLALPGADRYTWIHEGGYYREKEVFRPFAYCRMRDHEDPFCPVCCEEVAKAIHATCGLDWDDDAYHRAHPLHRKTWR